MSQILFGFPDDFNLAKSIANLLKVPLDDFIFRHFPDGETYIRIESDVKNKEVLLVCSLNQPDAKILPILFFTQTAKKLGATKITLIAPYLAYMRQDKIFHPGEAVTSVSFAKLLSETMDALITIDPHLHRYKSLDEIYTIPSKVLHANELIADWIKQQIEKPVLIGPDEESEQWVSSVAKQADVPYIVLRKVREGDKKVKIFVPHVKEYQGYTPVLVDDIISTAHTMIETVKHLQAAQMNPSVCIGIHPIFAGDAYQVLQKIGVAKIISCNTISHASNQIDVSHLIAKNLDK